MKLFLSRTETMKPITKFDTNDKISNFYTVKIEANVITVFDFEEKNIYFFNVF